MLWYIGTVVLILEIGVFFNYSILAIKHVGWSWRFRNLYYNW